MDGGLALVAEAMVEVGMAVEVKAEVVMVVVGMARAEEVMAAAGMVGAARPGRTACTGTPRSWRAVGRRMRRTAAAPAGRGGWAGSCSGRCPVARRARTPAARR